MCHPGAGGLRCACDNDKTVISELIMLYKYRSMKNESTCHPEAWSIRPKDPILLRSGETEPIL